ncbi:MAG: hypothetical protein N3A54_05610 [Patescibacteria group bacterium]|nr:hypothetical protein [Patescibacteria group bacterium]
MSAEHGGHGGDQEMRVVASMRERFKIMIEVVGKSFNSLANALLSILSFGKIDGFEESASQHGHH